MPSVFLRKKRWKKPCPWLEEDDLRPGRRDLHHQERVPNRLAVRGEHQPIVVPAEAADRDPEPTRGRLATLLVARHAHLLLRPRISARAPTVLLPVLDRHLKLPCLSYWLIPTEMIGDTASNTTFMFKTLSPTNFQLSNQLSNTIFHYF